MIDLLKMGEKAEAFHERTRYRNRTLAEQIADEMKRKAERKEKTELAPKTARIRGVDYVRADLAPEAFKRAMRD